jgi:Na+/H+-dicarboxylate symporter
VNVLEPVGGLNLSNVDLTSDQKVVKPKYFFENFIEHIVPKSILKR